MEIDARTSDAIAVAVRFGCPIYTYEFILSTAGVVLDENAEEGAEKGVAEVQPVEKKKPVASSLSESELSSTSTEELKELLKKAIDEEAYERASRIRDELARRKAN